MSYTYCGAVNGCLQGRGAEACAACVGMQDSILGAPLWTPCPGSRDMPRPASREPEWAGTFSGPLAAGAPLPSRVLVAVAFAHLTAPPRSLSGPGRLAGGKRLI